MFEPIRYVDERESKNPRVIRPWAKADHVMEGLNNDGVTRS